MKAIFKLAFAFVALLSFAACSDVPMPYEQPGDNPKGDEPSTETVAKGTGTQADPYNVTAALKVINALASGKETPTAIYVKGAVKQIKQIETELYGNANYYITDDGNNEIYIFQSYYLGNRKFTASDKLEVGDTVVVYGKFTNYMGNTPETVGKGTSYIYSLNGKTEGGTTPDTPAEGEATGDGTKDHPYNSVAANKYTSSLASGAESDKDIYIKGKVVSVKEQYGTQFGNATFYISDDGKADNQFYVFRALYLNNEKYASGATLNPGDEVVVCGKVTNYMGNTPETVQGKAYLVSLKSNGGGTTPDKPETGADISINASDFGLDDAKDMGEQTLSDGTTLTFDKGSNSNGPKYYKTAGGTIRMYPNNSVTINAGSKKVATIVLTCDSYKGTDYTAEGKLTSTSGKVNLSDLIYTISDINASSLTLTNSETGTGGKTQVRIKTITITYAK